LSGAAALAIVLTGRGDTRIKAPADQAAAFGP